MALADAIRNGAVVGGRKRPPGLRTGAGSKSCGGCAYFKAKSIDGAGTCRLYGQFPVRAGQVSNSYKPLGGAR